MKLHSLVDLWRPMKIALTLVLPKLELEEQCGRS